MFFRKLAIAGGLATVSLVALAAPASAATQLFSFELAEAGGLGVGPYGTVSVTEVSTPGGNALDFLISINNDFWRINDGNNNHRAFTFSLLNNPQVSVSNISNSAFTAVALPTNQGVSAPPFWTGGAEQFVGINYDGGGSGWNRGFVGPLSFRVMSSSYALTLNSLLSRTYNGQQVYFTSDLVTAQGATGNVGAIALSGPVPEPSAWALLILGFGAVGGAMRSARKSRPALNYI